jgi:hypothetical protein
MDTYRHSGAISPVGIFTASAAGIVTAAVLGIAYAFAVAYIPIVYVNALLTFGFGWLMGQAVGWGAKAGKIRNPFVATAYGFIAGAIGLYIAWGTDCLARFVIPEALPVSYLEAYQPDLLLFYIQAFYEQGLWSIKGGTVKGIPLAIVWAIEAIVIVGAATYYARAAIVHHPFCELCRHWTKKTVGSRSLSLFGADELLKQLLDGDLTTLDKFNLAQNEGTTLRLNVATCPACDESCFLTIQQVTVTINKEGKPETKVEALVNNMLIAAEDIPLIQNAGRIPEPPATEAEAPPEEGPSEIA